jgi:predicted PurR-regulated permease PerM
MSEQPAGASPIGDTVRESSIVPPWLVALAELGWRVLVITVLLVVLALAATVVWTVVAAIVLTIVVAAVFAPMVLRLRAQGHSRNRAAGIVWATIMLVGIAILLLLAVVFLPYLGELAETMGTSVSETQAELESAAAPAWVGDLIEQAAAAGREGVAQTVGTWLANVVGVVILAVFLLFFFLRDGDLAWLWVFQSAPPEKRERITAAGDEALKRVGGYLRGTTILASVVSLTDLLFMLLLGVPMAGPLAVLVFLGGYVPYFGSIVTSAIVLIVTYANVGPQAAIVMLVLMGARGVVLSTFVRPSVYGHTVHIHPALVLVVLPAGYELAGVIGLFAAVPVTAVILATADAALELVRPERPPRLPQLVPAWLDHLAQYSFRILVSLALIALFVVILAAIPLVIAPVIVATIFAAALEPVVKWLVERGRSRGRAAFVAVAGSFLAIVGLLVLAFVSLFEQADEIAATASDGADDIDTAASGQLGAVSDTIESGGAAAVETVANLSGAIPAIITVVVLATLLAFYFLRDGGELWRRVVTHASVRHQAWIDAAAGRAFGVLGGYMAGTAAVSFVGAASMFVIMVLLGLPLALPVFVLSFILGFIPYIGSLISTLIAFLIAVAAGSTTDVVIMGLWTLVFNIVQGNVVSPLVYGRTVHLHPAVVLVAIPAGSAVAGVLGMFLVVPALGAVAATWRTVIALLGGTEPDPPAGPDPDASVDTGEQPAPQTSASGST